MTGGPQISPCCLQALDHRALLDRYKQHTVHCKHCSGALKSAQTTIERAQVAAAAFFMATCAAAGVAASRITATTGAAGVGAVGGGAVFVQLLPVLGLAACMAASLMLVKQSRSTVETLTFVDYVHAERH